MSVPEASTTVTILVSVRTMSDPSHVTVREDTQGTECGAQVKLLSFLVLSLFRFALKRWSSPLVGNVNIPCFILCFHLQYFIAHLTVSSISRAVLHTFTFT